MRYLFLDFDGPLATGRQLRVRSAMDRRGMDRDASIRTKGDAECARLLNDLIARSNARIVVSSVWRKHESNEFYRLVWVRHVLNLWGVKGLVVGTTPVLTGEVAITDASDDAVSVEMSKPRGAEIQAWMDAHSVGPKDIVIIDDEGEMLHLTPRLVQVGFENGIEPKHVEQALALFAWRGGSRGTRQG